MRRPPTLPPPPKFGTGTQNWRLSPTRKRHYGPGNEVAVSGMIYQFLEKILSLRLQLHGAIYRPDSFVLMLRYCAFVLMLRYFLY